MNNTEQYITILCSTLVGKMTINHQIKEQHGDPISNPLKEQLLGLSQLEVLGPPDMGT